MRYYIIAGEASGDLHAGNLIKSIKEHDPNAEFRGWGGDLMESQGCELVKHYRDLAFMGFWEVFTHLGTILSNLRFCKKDILNYAPDKIILVDYPGFNLRVADFAKKQQIKVEYYIAPQVWAWKKGRVKKIKKNVDDLFVILPFEEAFYAKYDYPVHYVGNPLLDEIVKFDSNSEEVRNFKTKYNLDARPIVALLPGSRRQEIKTMLPVMAEVVEQFPEYQFVVSVVKWQPRSLYASIEGKATFIEGDTYPMLASSKAAVVTSGTASLETALLEVPQVVCYKGSWLSYYIALNLVKGINYISLANLILDKQIFTELIQGEMNKNRIGEELEKLLHDEKVIKQMKQDYKMLRGILGNGGATEKAAKIIVGN